MPALDYIARTHGGPQMSLLAESLIYLLAAVIAVPLSRRLGFGSVLGYLAAGIIIGPFGFAFIRDSNHILHFAELGVVFLLFIVGLELTGLCLGYCYHFARMGVWFQH